MPEAAIPQFPGIARLRPWLRTLLLALVIAVEFFGSIVHPFPADFDGNIPEHVQRFPGWGLGVVVLAWGVTFTAATGVATRIGNRMAGGLVAVLLGWALGFNLLALPYTLWFKVAMLAVFPLACLPGLFLVRPGVSLPRRTKELHSESGIP